MGDATGRETSHLDDLDELDQLAAREAALFGPAPESEYDRLETEGDRIDRALEAACALDPARGLEAVRLLRGFWVQRGHLADARRWTERLLEVAGEDPSAAHASGLVSLAAIAFRQGDNDLAKRSAERAIAEARALGRRDIELDALLRRAEEALRDVDPAGAVDYASRARGLAIALGDERQELSALHRLAEGTRIGGDLEAARPLYVESLERNRARGDRLLVAVESINLAAVEQATGNAETAEPLIRAALGRAIDLGSVYLLAAALVGLAGVLAALGRHGDAAGVIGRADALFETSGLVPDPADQPGFDRAAAIARSALGETEYLRLRELGRSMDAARLAS